MILELIFLSFTLLIIYWYLSKPNDLPPGPTGLPLLGYLPWLFYCRIDMLPSLMDIARFQGYFYAKKLIPKGQQKCWKDFGVKYGSIVCIRAGFSYLVFLNDVSVIKEAFVKQGGDFSNRGLRLFKEIITGGKGIVTADGEHHREQRQFIVKSLRNLGFGKMCFEEHIFDTVVTMRVAIDAHLAIHTTTSEPMDIQRCLAEAVADNICRIVLGQKFNSEELDFMISRLDMISRVPPALFLVNSFPFLLPFMKYKFFRSVIGLEHFKFFRSVIGLEHFKQIRIPLKKRIFVYIDQHKKSLVESDISDFLYAYLAEQGSHQKTKEDRSSWNDDQIAHACTELIVASVTTTEATIAWILLLVAREQTWQSQLHQEIDCVVDHARPLSTRDLPNLPLCNATILEGLRWSVLSSTGMPHSTTCNTRLRGFFIPAESAVFANLYATTHDPQMWNKPDEFNPATNFLSSNREQVINRDSIIPFGVGRRSCIGESLARMEVTMFFLNLLQTYSIHLSSKHGFPEINDGLFRIPSHRWLVFKKR